MCPSRPRYLRYFRCASIGGDTGGALDPRGEPGDDITHVIERRYFSAHGAKPGHDEREQGLKSNAIALPT